MQTCRKKLKQIILKIIMLCMIIIYALASPISIATETEIQADENCLIPTDDQYLELRAVQVKDISGQNKQVIMELWGHNLEFKRGRF